MLLQACMQWRAPACGCPVIRGLDRLAWICPAEIGALTARSLHHQLAYGRKHFKEHAVGCTCQAAFVSPVGEPEVEALPSHGAVMVMTQGACQMRPAPVTEVAFIAASTRFSSFLSAQNLSSLLWRTAFSATCLRP